jgi:hypothetical protein
MLIFQLCILKVVSLDPSQPVSSPLSGSAWWMLARIHARRLTLSLILRRMGPKRPWKLIYQPIIHGMKTKNLSRRIPPRPDPDSPHIWWTLGTVWIDLTVCCEFFELDLDFPIEKTLFLLQSLLAFIGKVGIECDGSED